jgi:predicted XRE-type DNA-binding protein
MNNEELEPVRGSGNVFRDFGVAGADAEQLRSILAAQIVKLLDARGLTVREAGRITGVAAADFSRIRCAHLQRFSIDRLMTILNRLDYRVEVTVTMRPIAIEQGG